MSGIIIVKKMDGNLVEANSFEKKMKRKYGSTYFIDMTPSERSKMEELNSHVDFSGICADGKTFDLQG